jgi:hypothetical protein
VSDDESTTTRYEEDCSLCVRVCLCVMKVARRSANVSAPVPTTAKPRARADR